MASTSEKLSMKYIITPELLASLQKGDHKAFEVVFLAYYHKIKNFIDGFVKSQTDAEDLTEELFANLWDNHANIDPGKSFNSYLHTMAHNAAINFLKHKMVHYTFITNSASVEYAHSSEDEVIARETSLIINMVVERMPKQRREIYKLSKTKGLKNEEIAEMLQTTKRNVESQLSLALKEIRNTLAIYLLLILIK